MLQPLFAFAAVAFQPAVVAVSPPGSPTVRTAGDRIARPTAQQPVSGIERIVIRVNSPQGLLWEGALNAGPNQSASYNQNISQASAEICPPGMHHDRSERSHLNLSIHAQSGQQWGQSYRVDASWARPIRSEGCVESGTRTVQLNQTIAIAPGETKTIEGDAGLRVQLSRPR